MDQTQEMREAGGEEGRVVLVSESLNAFLASSRRGIFSSAQKNGVEKGEKD
jgi:hypothetical protein